MYIEGAKAMGGNTAGALAPIMVVTPNCPVVIIFTKHTCSKRKEKKKEKKKKLVSLKHILSFEED